MPEAKIRDYLLNTKHANGAGKAKFFNEAGFSLDDVGTFIEALEKHFADRSVCVEEDTPHGRTRTIEKGHSTPHMAIGRSPQLGSSALPKITGN